MTLQEFALWYRDNNYPQNKNRFTGQIFCTENSVSNIVYDNGPFMVEHYLLTPNHINPPHSHSFESISIFVSGEALGTSEFTISSKWLTNEHSGYISKPLPIGKWHSFSTGSMGAEIYTVSKWDNEDDKNSAVVEYYGAIMGPLHQKLVDKHKKRQ